jgi:hypothetical protein
VNPKTLGEAAYRAYAGVSETIVLWEQLPACIKNAWEAAAHGVIVAASDQTRPIPQTKWSEADDDLKPAVFAVGDVVRYNDGPTALMLITNVHEHYGGGKQARYYGDQFYGMAMGAYHQDCQMLSQQDRENIAQWAAENGRDSHTHYVKMAEAVALMDERRRGK